MPSSAHDPHIQLQGYQQHPSASHLKNLVTRQAGYLWEVQRSYTDSCDFSGQHQIGPGSSTSFTITLSALDEVLHGSEIASSSKQGKITWGYHEHCTN